MDLHPTIYVNGYGATHDLDDANYGIYLGELLRRLRKDNLGRDSTVYLCGGLTNRPDLTEARCMLNIIKHLAIPTSAKFVLIEESTNPRDSLRQVFRLTGRVPLSAFCEFTREPTVRYLARRLFPEVMTVPIAFDKRSLAIGNQLKQRLLKHPLEVAASHSSIFDAIRIKLREKHMKRCRSEET